MEEFFARAVMGGTGVNGLNAAWYLKFDIITIPDERLFIKIYTWKVWLFEIKPCLGS